MVEGRDGFGAVEDRRVGWLVFLRDALLPPVAFVALLWVVELLDRILPAQLDANGIDPRTEHGISGIFLAPLLHDDFAHLIGNSIPLLFLGFLIALSGTRTFIVVTAITWVGAGVGVWLFAGGPSNHIGASGLVFGWITYLVVRGVFSRDWRQIFVGVGVALIYGTALLGVLPGQPGISWQGHLFGALSGIAAAWWLRRQERTAT